MVKERIERKRETSKEIKKLTRNTKIRSVTALFMTVVLAFGSISGCGKGDGDRDKSGNSSAKGRYMEEDIELPVQEGEAILSLLKSKDGNPLLFSRSGDAQVNRYEYIDGQWETSSLDWMNPVFEGQEIYPMDAQETEDGTQVVLGMDEEQLTHIARSKDGKTGEELNAAYLTQQTDYGYPVISRLQIDGSGHYWLQDMYQSKLAVIEPDTGNTIQEINSVMSFSNLQRLIFRNTDGSIAANTEDGTYTVYDKDLGVQGTFTLEQQTAVQMCGDAKNWYMISEEGITRLTVGNDIREVIMDGSMGAMGSPLNVPAGAVIGGENDFYVLYNQETSQTYSMAHYVYDEDIAAVPEKTLQVFGLSESDTVHQAITGFQKAHPDVKVEFQTSGKAEGEVSTDDIRTLNTELLSGNGADVLLLDGLPVDAYIEKGILADMTDLMESLLDEDSYLEAILKNTVQKDGKIYGLPVRFGVPVIYGNEEVKEAMKSLDSLKAYLDEQPDASVFGVADRVYIRDFLFQIYQEEILEENGKVNQEKLAELLELEGKIAVNAKAAIFEEELEGETLDAEGRNPFSNMGDAGIINHPEGASTNLIFGVANMMFPYAVMRQLELSPDTLDGMYLPEGVVGINRNSEQQELAVEFVKYLFSEEVQSAQLNDGLPVLISALESQKNEADSEYAQSFYGTSSWKLEGEDEIRIEAGYPTVEEVEGLIQMCHSLTKPAEQDRVVWNIYRDEADQYLGGNIDAETAAGNVAQKVDTYLAE